MSENPVWSGLIVIALAALGAAAIQGLTHSDPTEPPPAVAGWGPPRPVYWCKASGSCDGADHVTFNSYANNPNYGDERNFVIAKPARINKSGGWRDVLHVQPGEEVLIRLYVSNSAWTARLPGRSGVAVRTRARVGVPVPASSQHDVMGSVSAANARPRRVWDGVTLRSDSPTTLRFVFGSARWFTNLKPHGVPVPDNVVEEGAQIGSWALDGRVGNSFADTGILSLRVRVEAAKSPEL